MQPWKTHTRRFRGYIRGQANHLWQRLDPRPDSAEVIIQPYLGYGNREIIALRGRVLQDNGIMRADEHDTLWHNLLNTYRRFVTDEIPYAVVKARFDAQETVVTADEEGFFEVKFSVTDEMPADRMVDRVALELVSIPGQTDFADDVCAIGRVIIPGPQAEYGVISDIDDTVIQSDVLSLINLVRNTLFRNARTRLPFPGVAALYRALHEGSGGAGNPIHYVSSSPWNLYDLLIEFLQLKRIPPGPLFLKRAGRTEDQWLARVLASQKAEAIDEILAMYTYLPFVLIGDSTEHDPEIYARVAAQYPGRVRAIYIRDVRTSPKRRAEIEALIGRVASRGVPMHLVEDSTSAAVNAAALGLIPEDAVAAVRASSEQDQRLTNPVEKLIDSVSAQP